MAGTYTATPNMQTQCALGRPFRLRSQSPALQPLLKQASDLRMPRDIWVHVTGYLITISALRELQCVRGHSLWEDIVPRYPSGRVHEERVLISNEMSTRHVRQCRQPRTACRDRDIPLVHKKFVLAVVVVRDRTVGARPAPLVWHLSMNVDRVV